MFMGKYEHTIDNKGRVIIPSKYREQLGESFVITEGIDGCLFLFDNGEWESFVEKLSQLPLTNAKSRKFNRRFLSSANEVGTDKQGRILIPSALRESAALLKDVVLVGVTNRIEIWSAERWNSAISYENPDEFAETMEGIGI